MIGRGRVLVLVLVGCGGSGEATTDLPVSDTGVEILGRCDYTNPFSQRGECREYTGAGWDADAAASDP